MVNVDKYLENYKVTKRARIAAMATRTQAQGGSNATAAQRATASAPAPQYPKGRCFISGRITDIYYNEQYIFHAVRKLMKVVCDNGYVVIGAYPNKLENAKRGIGAPIRFTATFQIECNGPVAYFKHPIVVDSCWDGVECFTQVTDKVKKSVRSV